ncbi:MAG: sugar ABC transporter permease [Sphaerochaetaceae bacterium]|nr:sugar ABC transporter permease [Sphaerochaetaceae bacterium]
MQINKVSHSKDLKWVIIFVAPTLIGQLIFMLIPTISSFLIGFADWNLFSAPSFVGLKNYKYIFDDPLFYNVIKNTLVFTLFYVPLKIVIALAIANLINKKIKGVVFFRSVFFLPALTSMVAISVVWLWLYNTEFGLINILLSYIGIQGPDWLGDGNWAMVSIIVMSIWQGMGYAMIIILASLQNIPTTLVEAANIDGASKSRIFFSIKIPLLTPTLFFLLITNIFYGLQIFTEPFVLTKQGPADATNVLTTYMYDYAFRFQKMGIGSAIACILFVIMAIITFFQFKFDKWVNYEV